jgi:transposase
MPKSSPSPDRWAETLTKRFLSAELKAGRTPRETATEVGCSENTVRDHLARHGLLDISGVPKTIGRDYEHLKSITAVAELHQVSFATARRWLLGLGIPLNEAHRPESADVDVRQASRRYDSGESLADIAADLGVGVNTLKRRLEAAGVTMRARGRPSGRARLRGGT